MFLYATRIFAMWNKLILEYNKANNENHQFNRYAILHSFTQK